MKKIALLMIICLTVMSLHAQNISDSLFTEWRDTSQPDSKRASAYYSYIWDHYLFSDHDSANLLAESLHSFAQEKDYPKAAAQGYILQGLANNFLGNYPQGLEKLQKATLIFEEIGDNNGVAAGHMNIGIMYAMKGHYIRALEYYQKSLASFEKLGDQIGIGNGLNNIGNIYSEQGNYPKALEYYERSRELFEEIGIKEGISNSLNNIGITYKYLGDYPRALEYIEKAMVIFDELGDKSGIANGLNNKGTIYNNQNNSALALEFLGKSLVVFEELNDKSGIAMNLNNIGSIYQKQGKTQLALSYCLKGLTLAEEIGAIERQIGVCQCLYDSYKDLGKGNEALVYLEKMRIAEDSLNAAETAKKLEQMEFGRIMYQDSIDKAEEARMVQEKHTAEVLKNNKTRNLLIVFSLFLFLVATGLYSRWRYVRKAKTVIEKEKDRSENLLLNMLPADIAKELKEKGRADARDFDMVSILFTDFKGFTEQSSKLSASDLVSEINHCFEAFDGIMEKYGIEKIKTIGDAYMAAGGLPISSDDSVKNTVLAALEMQEFIKKRKADNSIEEKPAFEMRVGIHTGPVVAGIVGVKKFQYDIWGDTVNTASRMESSGEVGKVNVSQKTYELLKDFKDFTFESRGKIEAKGKGKVEMYFVSLA